MATDTSKITGAADDLSDKLTKGGSAAKTLGAEIANAIKSLDSRVSAIEAGGGTQPPVEPPGQQVGLITGFVNGSHAERFKVDDIDVQAENSNKAWNLEKIDDTTLQFETRSGDRWNNENAERTELQYQPRYNDGQQITVTEKITIMPGANVTASWVTLNQLHAVTNVAPTYCPFSFALDPNGDKLQVILQSPQGGNNYIWTAPQSVVRGQEYDLKMVMTMGSTGNGQVDVWLDGAQIVNFRGAVGATNSQYYWKIGLYRGLAAETTIVRHRNVHVTTG
jgi:hypothetical protein